MKRWIVLGCIGLCVFGAAGCRKEAPAKPAGVTVFAAASLAGVLDEVADRFRSDAGISIRINYASSSTLARQIEAGAACDVFISAHPAWLAYLRERGLVIGDSQMLAGNRLVLIAPRDREIQVEMRPGFALAETFSGRLALGDPDHVPAGMYARQALTALGWWEGLRDRLAPCADVRAALRAVETGQADAGIVYATDAALSDAVAVAFPQDTHDPIQYPAAACRNARPEASRFLDFLSTRAAREIIGRHGFITPAATATPAR